MGRAIQRILLTVVEGIRTKQQVESREGSEETVGGASSILGIKELVQSKPKSTCFRMALCIRSAK